MADRLRVAAAQVAERRRAHRAGRADFRLTAARRARDGGFCRDDLSDGAGDIHRAHHRIVVQSLTGLIGQQHRGRTPQLPAVGAATMHFIQALLSPISSACAMTCPM